MKYVLGLLFEYKYYKNPANIKIFSNNQLIDEIDLTEDINLKNIQIADDNISLYNWCKKWKGLPVEGTDFTSELQIPDKSFIYTLDETTVKNSIRIEVTNDNSNYSNGFMTKWSSFTFHEIFLIPTYYLNLENYIAFTKKLKQIRDSVPDYPAHDEWTRSYSLEWPNNPGIIKNGDFVNNSGVGDDGDWRKWEKGGSFSFEFPIFEYIHEKGLKVLGPLNYKQLKEKEKRHLITRAIMPLYLNQLKLINTQNETT